MMHRIKQIFIEDKAKADPLTSKVTSEFKAASVVVAEEDQLKKLFADMTSHEGKRSIFVTRAKGKMIKDCPGMQEHYLCCRLQVISPISNCPIFCSYCFLQFYLNSPAITVYTNFQTCMKEIEDLAMSEPKRLLRITTGELSDSLAFDKEMGISTQLAVGMKTLPNVILELKTKTDSVDHLLKRNDCSNVVLSWSLNTQKIVEEEEHLSSSLVNRIRAAKNASAFGYLVGFHFDPLIWYSSWEEDYEAVIKHLFAEIERARIAWISLGTMRFAPGMEDEMKRFFPKSMLPYGEFVKASDGKMRYIKPIRLHLYKKVLDMIRKYGGDEVFVYLCMEMADTWKEVMDFVPRSKAHLDYLFAESLHRRFPRRSFEKPSIRDYEQDKLLNEGASQ